MNKRLAKLGLYLLGGLSLLAASLLAAWALFWPCATLDSTDDIERTPTAAGRVVAFKPPLPPGPLDFEPLWDRPMRGTFIDVSPAPVLPTADASETSLQGMRLLGTVIEAGRSLAVFSLAGGQTELRGVGESVGESRQIEIVSIQRRQVVVRYIGELVTLTVEGTEES